MANLSINNILPNRVADIYIKLKSITSKLLICLYIELYIRRSHILLQTGRRETDP